MALRINAKGKNEADVYLYDVIGDVWGEGVTAKEFVKELHSLTSVKTINLHINSPGGSVFDGASIHSALVLHDARVISNVEGLAASAASLVAMAGDEIYIAENAFFMVHNPWSIAIGDANELRKSAELLEQLTDSYAKNYTARAGNKSSYEQFRTWMDDETWFDANAAVAAGLADKINAQLKTAAKFDLARCKYKNIPAQIKQQYSMPSDLARRIRLAEMDVEVAKIKNAIADRQSKKQRS
jgi:ATP-dependent Clp protease protease subunit